MATPFRRVGDQVQMNFEPGEVVIITQLVTDLVARLGEVDDAGPVADPSLKRLFIDGYADDPKAAAELRSLIQDDLRDGKIASAKLVIETLADLPPSGRLRLAPEQAQAWLGSLNDLRLTIGTALDVTEETDYEAVGGDDDDRFATSIYVFLGWLQECLVDALMG